MILLLLVIFQSLTDVYQKGTSSNNANIMDGFLDLGRNLFPDNLFEATFQQVLQILTILDAVNCALTQIANHLQTRRVNNSYTYFFYTIRFKPCTTRKPNPCMHPTAPKLLMRSPG